MGDHMRRRYLRGATVIGAVAVASALVAGATFVTSAAPEPAPVPSIPLSAAVPLTQAAATTKLPGWLHTNGSTIRTASNKKYVIKAVSWFGMETAECAPHGLWTIRLQNGLAQIKSMGFNTIRLPFSNECLDQKTTNSINFERNPSLEGKTPLQVMDFFVAKAKAAGLNVILDRHRPGSDAQSELWYTSKYSEKKWISDWTMLAKRYLDSSSVIGFDLHNEPHGAACWGCGTKSVDWRAAATRAGNAVLKVNPHVLILVEGVEKQSASSYTWWGGGLRGAQAYPVSLTVKHRVVYSPHDYPSSVYAQSWFASSNYPENLPGVWDRNWGYLAKQNIAPVLLGEFGTKLETNSDKQWLKKLVTYLRVNQISFAYWSFNPDSGDTGGLVKDDWKTRQSNKLAYLKPLLGSGSTIIDPAPDPVTPTTPTTPTPTSSAPAPEPADPPAGALLTAAWKLQSHWASGYVANIAVKSSTGAAGWTVSWRDAHVTGVTSSWGMTCTVAKKVSVTCTGAQYAVRLAAGQPVEVGLQVESTSAPANPTLTVTAR